MPRNVEAAFREFHQRNPDFYGEIVSIARKAKANGRTRVSMRGLFEFIRVSRTIQIKGDGEYAINNSYTSFYSDLVMSHEPDLAALFEVRASRRTVRKCEPCEFDDDVYDLISQV